MKKLKVVNLICLLSALVLEILPYGVKMKWADFFYESYTFHSYFDLTVWGYGDMGPFLCGAFTVVILGMVFATLFFKPKKSYLFALCAMGIASVMLSVIPSFFDSYTVFGLIITALLAVSAELNIVTYLNNK